ncbi:hypothetical protein ACFQQB_33755 [Nonomuraea rubra]|uniref:hypothetical protein n=1 Tax=Nonomuraea rubra TaxID=46180 RepID=UPI0036074385
MDRRPAPAALGIRYGNPDVTTDVLITRRTIRRTVRANAAATEQIPLVLRPDDVLTFTDGTRAAFGGSTTATADGFDVRRGRTTIRFRWGTPCRRPSRPAACTTSATTPAASTRCASRTRARSSSPSSWGDRHHGVTGSRPAHRPAVRAGRFRSCTPSPYSRSTR